MLSELHAKNLNRCNTGYDLLVYANEVKVTQSILCKAVCSAILEQWHLLKIDVAEELHYKFLFALQEHVKQSKLAAALHDCVTTQYFSSDIIYEPFTLACMAMNLAYTATEHVRYNINYEHCQMLANCVENATFCGKLRNTKVKSLQKSADTIRKILTCEIMNK